MRFCGRLCSKVAGHRCAQRILPGLGHNRKENWSTSDNLSRIVYKQCYVQHSVQLKAHARSCYYPCRNWQLFIRMSVAALGYNFSSVLQGEQFISIRSTSVHSTPSRLCLYNRHEWLGEWIANWCSCFRKFCAGSKCIHTTAALLTKYRYKMMDGTPTLSKRKRAE